MCWDMVRCDVVWCFEVGCVGIWCGVTWWRGVPGQKKWGSFPSSNRVLSVYFFLIATVGNTLALKFISLS